MGDARPDEFCERPDARLVGVAAAPDDTDPAVRGRSAEGAGDDALAGRERGQGERGDEGESEPGADELAERLETRRAEVVGDRAAVATERERLLAQAVSLGEEQHALAVQVLLAYARTRREGMARGGEEKEGLVEERLVGEAGRSDR